MIESAICLSFGIYTLLLFLWSLRAVALLQGFPELPRRAHLADGPFVSIIVPARDEEADLPACLASLLKLEYENREIIVVDDASVDHTAQILSKTRGIRTARTTEPPKGWIGKAWACTKGYAMAKGDVLLFTDADTVHSPSSLSSSLSYLMRSRVDMLTLWPSMELGSFWERVVMPIVFTSFFLDFGGKQVNDDDKSWYAGFGPYILITREAYEKVGTHNAVAFSVEEDYRLASLVKGCGFRLRVLFGFDEVRTRMYTGFREIWEGWSKNAFEGYGHSWRSALFDMAFLAATTVLPFGVAAIAVLLQSPCLFWAGIMGALVVGAREFFLFKELQCPPEYSLLAPLGAVVYMGIVMYSGVRHSLGLGVRWKDRTYY